ncbi:MAG: transglycosylase domain-containing protein [Clostridia bacterium]|nr:transglycosylase domain-containing protein [Clostridia bacterium]
MKKTFKLVSNILKITLIVGCIIIAGYVNEGYSMYKDAIAEKPIVEMLAEIESKDNYTKIDEVPKIYKDAVVAVEDHRFYTHKGVDILSIVRAVFTNLKNQDLIEGGSTISQQICKNIYFTQERKLERKFAEIFAAIELEKNCDKDKILELYFNTSFYGNGYYTLKEASNGYFDKEPIELTEYEATMIAGIPNAPSVYNPVNSLKLAKERQSQVLYAMVEFGYLTNDERNDIINEDIDLSRFEKQ